MPSNLQSHIPPRDRLAGAPIIDTTARWVADAEEVALGCESACPWLQIERWGADAQDASSH